MISLKVWGDYACFSRPEFKVERVSYPIMTPSAARGVLEAVFWKPEIRYEIAEIWMLKPETPENIHGQTTILRNELSDTQSGQPFFIDDKRQQRASLILTNVAYLICARIKKQPHATDPVKKYIDCFNRRAKRGSYHHTPYLGTREFAASFEIPDGTERPFLTDLPPTTMLLDIAFIEDKSRNEMQFMRHNAKGGRKVKGYAQSLFFNAKVNKGQMLVPPDAYDELYKLERGNA